MSLLSLSDGEIEELREYTEELFDKTGEVFRSTGSDIGPIGGQTVQDPRSGQVIDSRSGQAETWQSMGSYPCRLMGAESVMSTGQFSDQNSIPQMASRFVIGFPFESDVRALDRVQIDGNEYRIMDSDAGRSQRLMIMAHAYRIS